MPTPLFPKEIIEFSTEQHFAENSTTSKVIYIAILAFIIGALVALPFIKVDVSVKSAGIIRPSLEVNKVAAPVSGNILSLSITNNEPVTEGQELFTISSPVVDEQLAYHQNRLNELAEMKADLGMLIIAIQNSSFTAIGSFQTAIYRQSFEQFKQQLNEANNRYTKVQRAFERDQQLYEAKVIAAVEFEDRKFELKQAASQLKSIAEEQAGRWQSDLLRYRLEAEDLEGKLRQLFKEKEKYIVKAPMSGTIQNFSGLYPGSFIAANQPIAEISPDTSLIVESYISPADIGLIYSGIPAKFQIDAFDYNQWGIVTGRIIDISNDIQVVENQPVFKIKCVLDKTFLQLKNGYKGKLKKGMTVKSRFIVTERSLFQLLYDNVDDWLNPARG
ncbi:HlyD family secretion protein [Nafulsella turpanensis]|uniref:HlyD family secretion protein n=1 Tax=Nafulsella turpanensis TaxID=1265690 RepID=UPI00034BC660|nr:HlyD family efflux transporter periplasmic adaptor subunit [Nafulsella turpanensis]